MLDIYERVVYRVMNQQGANTEVYDTDHLLGAAEETAVIEQIVSVLQRECCSINYLNIYKYLDRYYANQTHH